MADFLDSEAELASEEEDSDNSLGSDEEISRKKKKKKKTKKKKHLVSSDDDEEDGEDLDRDLDDLIDDNVEEDGSEEEEGREKRKHEESDLEEDLDDDDIDLIEENLGIRVKRKQKLKRIRRMEDSEESEKEEEEGKTRRDIAKEIFDGDIDDDEAPREEQAPQAPVDYDVSHSESESDPDDFIVDEEGQPISKGKKKKHIIHDDAALQEAQDIFGVDFDIEDFQQYDDYEDEEDIEEYEEEEIEETEDGETIARPKTRKSRKSKSKNTTTIFEVFEPSELERGHFTDLDQEIRAADMPERFQLRQVPVCPTEGTELEEEAAWIYRQAFMTAPVSRQEYFEAEGPQFGASSLNRKGPECVDKIQQALNFIRNQIFEVPFIAFYRKECVEPELNINDLWKVYHWDEKWMQLRNRKQNLVRLFEKMQQYQFDQIDPEQPLESHIRALTQDDIDRAKSVQSMEELRDVYQHFLLYYGTEIPKMKNALKARKRKEREERGETEGEQEAEDLEEEEETLKQASRKTGYSICVSAGLAELARKFGLTPEQFGENMRDNYQRHDVEQDPAEPTDLAHEFIREQFSTEEDVLKGARHMVAMQIAHDPLVRQCVREAFKDRAKISLKQTRKGMKMIDESHPCYTFKYLKNKPLRDLMDDQFLKIVQAEEDGLLEYTIYIDDKESEVASTTYFEEIKQLYHRDEFSNLVQEWNNQRSAALERALNMIIYPQMIRELKGKLLEESKEAVIRASCRRLYNWLKVAPYQPDNIMDDEDEEFDSSKGVRVMGLGFSTDRDENSFCAIIDGDGEVTDYMKLQYIKNRRNNYRPGLNQNKLDELEKLKEFIATKKPHVIAVSAVARESSTIMEDIQGVISQLEEERQTAHINVELVDNELAFIYSNSKKAEHDFREYPAMLRQAISVARRLQDPLIEFAQLCNQDEDILCLRFHALQDSVPKEDLLNALYLEFVNRVNEVGVDINRCVTHPHTSTLVQFVCGLGPRKGYNVLKILKQRNSRLENRTQLVTMCNMGPKVFINCAGFIKIDTTALGDSTEAYIEVLDGSRVHPETYEWARKMAVDALEYDDTAEDANPAGPAGALEEILESPERLRDLDLDAFADELERQGYGHKHTTLYDIRAELNERYKDLRATYLRPTAEERFNMLTKETPETFYIGKLILCTVVGFAHKRPHGEQLDNANPVRNDETGLWQCPFCQKNDFPELSEVWNHFDAGECPGQAVGVRTRLDNGVSGFIPLRCLSDKEVTNPEDRVREGMTLHARITKIDIEKFQVELTCKTSDLVDKENKWKLQKDPYFDTDTAEKEARKEEDKNKQKARQTYVKRVIAHPSFQNIDYKSCERMMANMDQGEVIIRPSSKGTDHLTCTWKVAEGVLQHIDVREEGKENAFSLGSSLWIGNEEFEDLDEIIARYIQPMAALTREMLDYKYYKDTDGGQREIVERFVKEEKKKQPSRIPYYFTASKQYPGKFLLAYMPRNSVKYEFISITGEGYKYRQQMFQSVNQLVKYFKEHFREVIPGTPHLKTPMAAVAATPSINLQNVDVATIQRAAAGLPSSVYNTLAQVAGQTPYGGYNQFQQHITTPMLTPMMTPMQPHIMTPAQHVVSTPRLGQSHTPAHLTTPSQPAMATPQYQPTPRATWNNTTHNPTPSTNPNPGGSTPRSAASVTPRQTPRQTPPTQRATPGGTTSQDWAKMAEQWAKKRQQLEQPRKQRTPRPGQSPMDLGTPGGGTPLIDER